jgi:hypothetical protein
MVREGYIRHLGVMNVDAETLHIVRPTSTLLTPDTSEASNPHSPTLPQHRA